VTIRVDMRQVVLVIGSAVDLVAGNLGECHAAAVG